MQSVHMHWASLSIYLPIHLSIYISLSRYVCIYIFICHSIYLSLYMIIIKRYCLQIEQLKLWQKQNILYFENDAILWWIYILIGISLWQPSFTLSPLNYIIFRVCSIYIYNYYMRYYIYNVVFYIEDTDVTQIFTDDILFSLNVQFCQEVRPDIRKK